MKAEVAAFNQEKALVGAFSVITDLRMELFEALVPEVRLAMVEVSGTSLPPLSLYPHLASPLHKVVTKLKSK